MAYGNRLKQLLRSRRQKRTMFSLFIIEIYPANGRYLLFENALANSSYFFKYSLINFQDYLPILLIYLRELAKDKW